MGLLHVIQRDRSLDNGKLCRLDGLTLLKRETHSRRRFAFQGLESLTQSPYCETMLATLPLD